MTLSYFARLDTKGFSVRKKLYLVVASASLKHPYFLTETSTIFLIIIKAAFILFNFNKRGHL